MQLIFLVAGLVASTPLGFIVLFQNPPALGVFAVVMAGLVALSLFVRKALAAKLPERADLILPRFWLCAAAASFAAALGFAWGACSKAPADGLCVIGGAHAMPYVCFALAAAAIAHWRARAAKQISG